LQWICINTGEAYRKYWKSKAHSHQLELSTIHWIGPTESKFVLLYLHGGGYVLPALEGHLKALHFLEQELNARTPGCIRIAMLEYSLVNFAPWPVQFEQAMSSIHHLNSLGIRNESIIIGGDSAGGHLALAIISQCLHPHPALPHLQLPQDQSKFRAIFLMSPWTGFESESASHAYNSDSDLIPDETLYAWGQLYKSTATKLVVGSENERDCYLEPCSASPAWWKGIENVTDNIYFTASRGECMFDDTSATVRSIQEISPKGWNLTYNVEGRPFIHNEFLGEFASGDGPREVAMKLLDFLIKVVN